MPIESIRLTRFRGFSEPTELTLAPLTVILGPNSAGKSSFGHALVGLAQAQRASGNFPINLDRPESRPRGDPRWPVDLGSADELRSTGTEGTIGLALRVPAGWCELEFGGSQGGLALSRLEFKPNVEASAAIPIELQQTGEPVQEGALIDVHYHPGVGPQETEILSATAATEGGGLLPARSPYRTRGLLRWGNEAWLDDEGQPVVVSYRGLEPVSCNRLDEARSAEQCEGAWPHLASVLSATRYLRATRAAPDRKYPRGDEPPEDVGPCGEWTADFLLAKKNEGLVVGVRKPPKAPLTVKEAAAHLDLEWPLEMMGIEDALRYWLDHLKLGKRVTSGLDDDKRNVLLCVALQESSTPRALTDLGFGVSQVVPVLVAGLALKNEQLLVVEQPGAQLHPGAQALLADFFCSVVLAGGRLLVETHSEALFQRLRMRAALDKKLATLIKAVFLDEPDPETGRCCLPHELALDDALRWPEGFLLQGMEDEKARLAARGARKAKGEG